MNLVRIQPSWCQYCWSSRPYRSQRGCTWIYKKKVKWKIHQPIFWKNKIRLLERKKKRLACTSIFFGSSRRGRRMALIKDLALGKTKCYCFIKPYFCWYDYKCLSLKSFLYNNVILGFTFLKLTDSTRSWWVLYSPSMQTVYRLLEAHESQAEQHLSRRAVWTL